YFRGAGIRPVLPICRINHARLQGRYETRFSSMGPEVPGLVWGCLVWDDPGSPSLDDALEHWRPVH
ncbi:hypothetical protein ABZ441_33270, partial [Streptomyces sp. NPDC005752]